MKKYFNKILCFLSVSIIVFSSFCFSSSAAQNTDNTFTISSGRPSASDNTGFIEILLKNSSGSYAVRTFAFHLSRTVGSSGGSSSEDIDNNYVSARLESSSKLTFSVFSSDVVGSWAAHLFSIDNGENYLYRTIPVDESWSYTTSSYSIVAVHFYGCVSFSVSSGVTLSNDEFYVLYSDETVEYMQLLDVISVLNRLASNDETIISKLQSIINNTDTIESKLQSALNLLTTIESDLDDVNAELDRIESNTDDLESKLDKIISILDNENQDTPKPDTSTTDDYSAKEEALIGGTSAGREEANTVFTDFNSTMSDNVGRGLLAVTAIFKEFTHISWLDTLIKFSLALGVFGFILGMGFFLVSSAAGKEARSERKDANKLRSQYYKSGIERNNASIDYYNSRGKK